MMNMPAPSRSLLLAGCFLIACAGMARASGPLGPSGLQLEGRRLIWQGEMLPEHAEEAGRLIRQGKVDALELRNSPGASKYASPIFSSVYWAMKERKLPTYARGICGSVCASILLSGREPTLLKSLTPGVPTVLMFHAVRYQGAVDPALTRTRIADIAAVRGEPARRVLLRMADDKLPLAAAMYVFSTPVKVDAGRSAVLFCNGQPGQTLKQCEPLPEAAMRDLGVINGL